MTDDKRDENDTVRLETHEVEQLTDFRGMMSDDVLETQEMDAKVNLQQTNPSQPVMDVTQRYDVPEDLMELATRSQEMHVLLAQDDVDWREFIGVVDPRGRIILPSRVQAELRGKKVRVKYVVVD